MATLSCEHAEAMAMAVLASTQLLRINEAVTIRRKERGVVDFYGVENWVGWHAQLVGPWPSLWLEFLHNSRLQRAGNAECNTNSGCARDPEKAFAKLVARTSTPKMRWHSLCRMAAAQIWASGCRGSAL